MITHCDGTHPRELRVFHPDGRRSCGCGAQLPPEAPTPEPARIIAAAYPEDER